MILLGDCLERLKTLEENSVDAVVTDPPYGWRFMGKAWDDSNIMKIAVQGKRPGDTYVGVDGVTRKTRNQTAEAAGKYDQSLKGNEAFSEWTEMYAREILRVLKPGGHALIFCGPRTYHAMAFGVERAGFEIRDMLSWIFGSAFPKSHNLDGDWKGFGTALKPAHEPIVLARKPLSESTVAKNVLKWGVGALNIDESRIGFSGGEAVAMYKQGRWPANLLLDEAAAAMLDEQSGVLQKRGNKKPSSMGGGMYGHGKIEKIGFVDPSDEKYGASRFFYVAKASKRERNAGLEGMPEVTTSPGCHGEMPIDDDGKERDRFSVKTKNHHPTVKPIKLMEYLIKLVTPPGGTVLDPFMGSGSTGVAAFRLGFKFIGIEMNEEYVEIARKRIEHAKEMAQ